MQEIKFRAWDEDLKKMFYTGFKVSYDGTVCMYNQEWLDDLINGGFTKDGFHQPKILMQYTGLKDKNGVELYEGDIYETEYGNAVIIWNQKLARFELRVSETQHWSMMIFNIHNYPLLGNIHENPELLNKD